MKVTILAADKGGCGFYRSVQPARVARDLGVDVEVTYGIDVEAVENTETRLVDVKEVDSDADLIVVQRPLSNALTSMIAQAQRQGIATVVEIDDDFDSTNRFNIAHKGMFGYEYSGADWVHEACKIADLITVSTPYLEKYAPHGRVAVLRNCVPESIFDYTPVYNTTNNLSVGWSGSTQTHPTDLQVTKGAVNEILKETGAKFSAVGDGAKVQKFLNLDNSVSFSATGWLPVEQFYGSLQTSIDIGIVPLELSNFNRAKSSIKGLEMASLGIPFVASPTSEYIRLEAYGVGRLAKSPGDWRRNLRRWLVNRESAMLEAARYRDIIYSNFTYELNAESWVKAWEKAITNRKQSS